MIAFGNCGGIVATFTFLARDAPEYRTGYALLLGFLTWAAVAQPGYAGIVWKGNREEKRSSVGEDADDGGKKISANQSRWRAVL